MTASVALTLGYVAQALFAVGALQGQHGVQERRTVASVSRHYPFHVSGSPHKP